MSQNEGKTKFKFVPRFGIFGPTRELKEGVDIEELRKRDSNGVELEFCTEEMNNQFENLISQEDKYFNTPESMKGSYLLDEYESTNAKELAENLSSFEKLAVTMKNLTKDGGVKKMIKREGVGAVVPACSKIYAHYNAFLEDMVEPYDSTRLRGKQLQVTLGNGSVIEGLDIGISTMRKREVARFLISPDYAYGKLGCMPRIPGDASLLFEVELLQFMEPSLLTEYEESCEDDKKKYSFDKMIGIAKAEKSEADSLYNQQFYKKAMKKYMGAVNLVESIQLKNQKEEDAVVNITSKIFLNIGLTNLKLGHFKKALSAGRRVLEYNPSYVKAMYINGCALRHIGDFVESRKYLFEANRLAPQSKDIVRELRALDELELNYKLMEKITCQKMFPSK